MQDEALDRDRESFWCFRYFCHDRNIGNYRRKVKTRRAGNAGRLRPGCGSARAGSYSAAICSGGGRAGGACTLRRVIHWLARSR